MRIELSFTDYSKNDQGVLITVHDLQVLAKTLHFGGSLRVTDHAGKTTFHRLDKIADLRLSIHTQ